MGPQPRRLMRDAVHAKGVEPYFFFHEPVPRSARFKAGNVRTCCIRPRVGKANSQPVLPAKPDVGTLDSEKFTTLKERHDQS
jgi:hypothetical protein